MNRILPLPFPFWKIKDKKTKSQLLELSIKRLEKNCTPPPGSTICDDINLYQWLSDLDGRVRKLEAEIKRRKK